MDYFELYDLPVTFEVDAPALKRKFYALSRQYHPDFHTDKSQEEQDRMLEVSSLNNKAYRTLSDFDARMRYILDSKNLLEEGKDKLPQTFLMDMMDINEVIMELNFEPNPLKLSCLYSDLKQLEDHILTEVQPIISNYDDTQATAEELEKVKKFYLKKRYFLRIREKLSKFASA